MTRTKIVKKLSDKGFPIHSNEYQSAHKKANVAEKKKFPKGYSKLKKVEKSLDKHELMGKNTKSGKIEVEKKFKPYSKEIAYHEKIEHQNIKRLAKSRKKK